MRIIHTADWHIGNNFYDHDRSAEHRDFLDFLLRAIHDHEADALVIAGDVFDNPNPSAAAQKLYYDFLGKASEQNPGLQIVVTAGNHDSGMRLEAARTLLEGRKIYIRGFLHTEEGDSAMLDDLLIPLHSRRNPDDEVICIAVPFLRSSDLPVEDSFSRSMGRTKTTMTVSILMNVLNVIGNAIGVFALHAGAAGVAWPTTISWYFAAVVMVSLCFRSGKEVQIRMDLILRRETDRIVENLPDAELVIVEGADHGSYIVGSRIMGEMLIDFFGRHSRI